MKKIIFLGSNSFTGCHFKKFATKNSLTEEYEFLGLDLHDKEVTFDIYSDIPADIGYQQCSLLDYPALENVICSFMPDYILNFAGTFNAPSLDDYIRINFGIAKNIFDILVKNSLNVRNVLLIGSAAEYGDSPEIPLKEESMLSPVNFYGLSKVLQTSLAKFYSKNYNINANVARTFNIIGQGLSRSLSIGSFAAQIKTLPDGATINVGNLKARRDYLHIDDVISAYWQILLHGRRGEVYNVCSSESVSIEELLRSMINASGKKLTTSVHQDFIKQNDIPDIYGSNEKLTLHTGWLPSRSILDEDAVKQLVT